VTEQGTAAAEQRPTRHRPSSAYPLPTRGRTKKMKAKKKAYKDISISNHSIFLCKTQI